YSISLVRPTIITGSSILEISPRRRRGTQISSPVLVLRTRTSDQVARWYNHSLWAMFPMGGQNENGRGPSCSRGGGAGGTAISVNSAFVSYVIPLENRGGRAYSGVSRTPCTAIITIIITTT